jgi:hypothetical protein
MKFFDHIIDRGGKVALQAIDQPPVEFGTPQAIFEQVLSTSSTSPRASTSSTNRPWPRKISPPRSS